MLYDLVFIGLDWLLEYDVVVEICVEFFDCLVVFILLVDVDE